MEPEIINMTYRYEKSSLIIILHIYFGKCEAKDKKTIRIFNPYFVKKHKCKYKIIINNKLYSLSEKYQMDNENMKQLKIKLLVVNNKKIDFSYMFYECKSLKKFNLLSKEEMMLEKEHRDKNINEYSEIIYENNSNDLDNQLNETFTKTYNNSDINTIINQAINIFYKNNYSSENDCNGYMNSIINLSQYFLSASYSKIELLNSNNDFEYNLLSEISFILNFSGIKGYLDNIIATDLSYMFYGCSSLLSITGLSKINTSNVTNLSYMFGNCSLLENICDISNWDTKMLID